MAHVECRVAHRYPGGDHEIVVGEVLRMEASHGLPLAFHGGRFRSITDEAVPSSR